MDPLPPPPPPDPFYAPPTPAALPPGYTPPYDASSLTVLAPPPRPPRIWTVFVAFIAAFFVGSLVAGIVAVAIAIAIHGPGLMEDPSRLEMVITQPPIFLPMLFATQVVLAGAAVIGGLLSRVPMRQRLRLGWPQMPWHGYVVFAIGTVALGYTSGIVIELLGFGDHGVLEEFEKAIASLHGPVLIIAALVIGLSPGFGEELLFRGYIQTRLRRRWPRLLALAVTSVLFGIIHFDFVQSTFAVFLGLWLGEVTDRTGSIWPAVVGHAVNNAAATVMGALLGSQQAVTSSPAWDLALAIPVIALCLVYLLTHPVVPVESRPPPDVAPLPLDHVPPAAPVA